IFGFLAASFVAWSPVLFVWGPQSYLRSLAMAQQTHLRDAYWSLASIWDGIDPGTAPRFLETLRYFLSGAVAIFGGMRVRSIDGVIVVGTAAFMIAAVAPVICYRVDDWLRQMLPELIHAYEEAPVIGRRLHRATGAAPMPAPMPAPLRAAETSAPVGLASAIQVVPRARARTSRNLTG